MRNKYGHDKTIKMIQEQNLYRKIEKTAKEALREKLERDTAEFLKHNKITEVPVGVSAESIERLSAKQKIRLGIKDQADSNVVEPSSGIA
jgi:hypothetical protein